MSKNPSRPDRWASAIAKMREGLSELETLKEEYQDWQDNLPESTQDGATADKLQAVADIDLDQISEALDECESAELPRGFGRD